MKHHGKSEHYKITLCIGMLYALSVSSFATTLTPGIEAIVLATLAGAFITATAAITIPFSPKNSTAPKLHQSDLYSTLRFGWLVSIALTIYSIADLAQSVYLTTLIRDEVTLGTIRGDFFQTENFRSAGGRIAGQAFVTFSCLTAVLFRFSGEWRRLIAAFIVAATYSLLMGGRGQIIFFSLAVLPSLLARVSMAKVLMLVGALIGLLGFVHEIRTPGGGQGTLQSISQYLATPWWGLTTLTLQDQPEYQINLLRDGAPNVLENHAFPIFGNFGNLFGGTGQLLYTFGWIGGPAYFILIAIVFCILKRMSSESPLLSAMLQSLAFMYFSFFLFHDLTIFYSSYTLGLAIVFILALVRRLPKIRLKPTSHE